MQQKQEENNILINYFLLEVCAGFRAHKRKYKNAHLSLVSLVGHLKLETKHLTDKYLSVSAIQFIHFKGISQYIQSIPQACPFK